MTTSLRVMPGIQHESGRLNEPVQRSFENIVVRDEEISSWIEHMIEWKGWAKTEYTLAKAQGSATGLTTGISAGSVLTIDTFQSTDTAMIDNPSAGNIVLAAGYPYLLQAWFHAELSSSTDTSAFRWRDVTGGSNVGNIVTLRGAVQIDGNWPAQFITSKLGASTTFSGRIGAVSGSLIEVDWGFTVMQLSPGETEPTEPDIPETQS